MEDISALLHNMSAPPKSVMKYSGLAEIAAEKKLGGTGVCGVFGMPARFVLPTELVDKSAAEILRYLGGGSPPDPERALVALIDERSNRLPLPDGCAVIPANDSHEVIWANDVLTALAILAKCSESVWLRSKRPALNAALRRRQVTLLVPPRFTDTLKERFQ